MEKAVWKLSPQLWNADLESSAIFLTFAHQIILTHMSYPICFVSLGPGDPELITLKGLKKLRQADIIYCPATISKSGQLLSRAARIIEGLEIEKSVVQFFTLPMSKDRTKVWKVYDTLYEKAISARDKEKKVVIVAEGDAGFYSSIQYIYDKFKENRIEVERTAGIPAFIAAGALAGLHIVKQEEQIIVDKHDGIRSDVKSITVNEMFDLWCQLKRGIKDSTFKNYIYMYELFVKPSFGKNRLVQVKKSDVRKFYNSLADGKVLKIATIDNVHNVLHQVFQVAVDDGMIRQNPTDNMLKELKLSHGFEREKKEALTVAQQKLFFDYMLSHPKDTHWYPVFYVMANTGMRVGEITGLRWSDIDLKKGIIRVNHTLVYYNHRDEKGCYFSINTPKTKAGEREIPMTEGVKQAFLMEREFQSQAEISSKSRVDGYDDFIFVNRYGDVQNQGNLNKALRRMMRDCNDEILEKYGADSDPVLLPQFSCHILRHTFATRLCESGANLKFIQSILGHADVSTTMNIYVDVTDALKKKEITAFDDYMTTKLET